jgi:acetylornithine aminotransferase/acetylornithine/N-succinyldiaminopimelate aminotransferase
MSRTADVQALESRHVLQVYRRAPLVLTRGEGVHLWDVDGNRYLDLISGVGVASLGHANRKLADIMTEQARTLLHCSNLFYHPLQGQVAERLANLSGLARAFFCNSGTEAIEACLKFARRHWYTEGDRGRTEILALEHAFHGRTLGSLSVTWDDHYRAPFEPLVPGVRFIKPNDIDGLHASVSRSTAAILVEPIQGEGGVRPLTPAFAQAIGEACDRTGALLIADEVQCGLGRTGYPFAFSTLGLKPDLVAIGKALGAGIPVGAALFSDRVAASAAYGDHGSTYGGNLLACRAALFFLDEVFSHGLLSQIARVGEHFESRLGELATKHAGLVREVRGRGLMWGVDLVADAAPVVDAARRRGLLVNRTSGTVVRMLPPLTILESDLDEAARILDDVFAEIGSGVAA